MTTPLSLPINWSPRPFLRLSAGGHAPPPPYIFSGRPRPPTPTRPSGGGHAPPAHSARGHPPVSEGRGFLPEEAGFGGGDASPEAEAAAVAEGTRRECPRDTRQHRQQHRGGHREGGSRPPPPPPPGPSPPPPIHHPPLHRRRHPPGTGADVFVTARTDFRAQLRRCQRLLSGGARGVGGSRGGPPVVPPGELRLHGLGLAVPRTINLALQLQAGAPGALRLHASTSSVEGLEEEDEEDGDGASPRLRHNSAIHIRVCREAPCA
ncbi:LOW QUALITY PROTEIN: ribonuclease P protein subunit p20 [Buteo buteo]|uniref:LOW QUALITY PROTEIN: ribonuclease P protein subunit p20 n=1 Tax=Buteo buteo TaxID=30397 RepID=UPI003EB6E413